MSSKGNQTGHDVTDEEKSVEELYVPGHPDNGAAPRSGNVTLNSRDDISSESKLTLGSYLSKLTQGKVTDSKNTFAIDSDPSTSEGHSQISDAHSQKVPDADLDSGMTAGTYLDVIKNISNEGNKAKNRFLKTKHSEYAGGNPFLGTDAKDRSKAPGHTLLASTHEVGATSAIPGAPGVPTGADHKPEDYPEHQQKISQVLKRNRFNPSGETPFMTDNEKNEFGYTVQTGMGEYDADADQAEADELFNVGLRLIANATGHNLIGVDSFDLALAPTLAQFTGYPVIEEGTMFAQNTPQGKKLTKERSNLLNDTFNRNSYGQLNSHLEWFDGPMPIGMIVNTVAGMAGLLAITGTIAGIITLVTGKNPATEGGAGIPYKHPIKLAKGRHARKGEETAGMFAELFGIPQTDHNLALCIFMGTVSFYGVDTMPEGDPPDPKSIIDSFLNIAMAPGYYNVVTRNVMRDTNQIGDAIAEFATPKGVSGAVTAVFKLIEAIVNSSTYRFLMAMAALGNQVLSANTKHPRVHPQSRVDSLPDTAPNRVKKSRISNKKKMIRGQGRNVPGALAWRHAASPARYILPESFRNAVNLGGKLGYGDMEAAVSNITAYREGAENELEVGDRTGQSNLGNGTAFKGTLTKNKGRLPKEYVEFIENGLESEYMPFYFHDLRTNEIISFHAFMTEMADGFSAEYSNTTGYGRADDIMIYNKTTRNISLGFMLAATSREDLDVMYYNVNKLVSMMYPQYSRGRVVVHGSGRTADRFVQPFSQIPTASPMIRLRFGDMLKSNYSKFNIARLFGVGQPSTAFNLIKDDFDDISTKKLEEEKEKARETMRLEEGRAKIDPGADNASQAAALRELGLEVTDDTDLGYQKDHIVVLDPTILYWPRKEDGKQARENDEKRADVGAALDLFNYESHLPKVKVVARVTTAGAANPDDFSELRGTTGAAGYVEPAEQAGKEMGYLVEVQDGTPTATVLGTIHGTGYKYHRAEHSEIIGLDPAYVSERIKSITGDTAPASVKEPLPMAASTIAAFMDERNNPIIRSFESARGKGLAGFMTELSFDWAEAPWETSLGARAPQFMKVNITFKPIHDVPMGLDSDGMMRSVAYPVGISRALNGEVYAEGKTEEEMAAAEAAATPTGAGTDTDESKADKAREASASSDPT